MPRKFRTTITFEIEGVETLRSPGYKSELREFIKDALEGWGGQRHPEDWLFGSLDKVQLSAIERVEMEDGQL